MTTSNNPELLVFDRRRRALIDSLLVELCEITGCDCSAFTDIRNNRDGVITHFRSGSTPEFDPQSLVSLFTRVLMKEPEYTIIDRKIIDPGPRLGPVVEAFEREQIDVVLSIPLLDNGILLGAACLFGKVPPVDPEALRNDLKPRIEGLINITANAFAALLPALDRVLEPGVHQEALLGLPEGMILVDRSGIILESNRVFADILDTSPEDLNGKDILKHIKISRYTKQLIEKLFSTGRAFDAIENLGVDSDPEDEIFNTEPRLQGKFYRLRGTPYPTGSSSPSGMILLADDVTESIFQQKEAESREKKHAQELELAKHLQQDFFPLTYQKKRIRIATRLIAAAELAGDFFDIFDLGPSTIGLVIGDVVGRGVPGSLMAMSVHGMIANQAGALTPPMKVLERVNDALFHQVKGDYWYGTCFYAKIHVTQLRVTYARAGHELPLWWSCETDEIKTLEGEGLPLGIFPDSSYTTQQVHLNEGDKLLLYTDGLTDTINPAGERFGHDNLIELFRRNTNLSPKNLLRLFENTIRDFRNGREQLDDIAMALISVVPDSWSTVTIPPFSFHEIAENLLNELDLKGVDVDTCFKVRLSLDECVTNAFRHGHRCDERKQITVGYLVESDRVTMKVRDNGQGFDFGLIPDPTLEENLLQPGGRGVFLTMKLMDEVQFNDVGNEITLTKFLHGFSGIS